jgi:hypothetical protein
MTLSSYSDVFGVAHERGFDDEIHAGDLVSTGPNLHPYFEVLAVHGDKAWVRNVQNGSDHLALVNRCRRLGGALDGLAMAAE